MKFALGADDWNRVGIKHSICLEVRYVLKKILIVMGTRPEAIKLCPLINELKTHEQFQVIVCSSGQHRELLDQVLRIFQVIPDYELSVMREKQSLSELTTDVLRGLTTVSEKVSPDLVLVHGDTTTAYASALAAFYMKIPIGHIEAGLRTYNIRIPFPEEFNRQSIGMMSTYHFAPTQRARENLLREGKPPSRIYVTGNTVVDALKTTIQSSYTHPLLEWAEGSRLILITAHRRENLGLPMENMFNAIRRVVREHSDVKVIYPAHFNPLVRESAHNLLDGESRIRIVEALDVRDFHNIMARSYLILTDSGGIQEEAPLLGKPVLVLRDVTERPEGIETGTLKLVGTNASSIYENFSSVLNDPIEYQRMSRVSNQYGDGNASKRIAEILLRL